MPAKYSTPSRGSAKKGAKSPKQSAASSGAALLTPLTGMLALLFLLSLMTMALFYAQLQVAEEGIGTMVIPYVKGVEDSTSSLYLRGLRGVEEWAHRQQQVAAAGGVKGGDDDNEADEGETQAEILIKQQQREQEQELQRQRRQQEHRESQRQKILNHVHEERNVVAAAAQTCQHLEEVAYWHNPTPADLAYSNEFMRWGVQRRASGKAIREQALKGVRKTPAERLREYHTLDEQYVTFEPDVGGWNNIRMQMEVVLVFALVTGRTLVLPFDQPMYLLMQGKGAQNVHSFDDYFPFDWISQRMPVITMAEFLEREGKAGQLFRHNTTTSRPRGRFGGNDGADMTHNHRPPPGSPNASDPTAHVTPLVVYPPKNSSIHNCGIREERWAVFDYLREVGACPHFKSYKEFVAIPRTPEYDYTEQLRMAKAGSSEHRVAQDIKTRITAFATDRKPQYYNRYWQKQKVIHFISKPDLHLGYRIMDHFYSIIFLEDERTDHFAKRFVRDYVHYVQPLFCKAALIVHSLLEEAKGGGYSAFHVRRGDLQFKEVKIPTGVLLQNVGEFIEEKQLLYIATDVRDRSYFDPMRARFPQLRFLGDYAELVGLKDMNPNFLGMLDQIVCTRGDVFVGTWFSTFTGYITRMRGYMHHLDSSNFYGDLKHRDRMQVPELMKFPYYMREWNESWWGVDDDDHVVG